MLSSTLYTSPARRAKSPLGRKNSTRAYPASSPRRIPVAFVSLRQRCKPRVRKHIEIHAIQPKAHSHLSNGKAIISLGDYGGHLASSPPRSSATPAPLTGGLPLTLCDSSKAADPTTFLLSSVAPLAIDMELSGEESLDMDRYPRPLAQRPFWMPPSSPGGLKPRYPAASSQVKQSLPSPLRKLRRSVIRIAKAADNSLQARREPRRASINSLEDSELPYAKLRDSIAGDVEARTGSPRRSSSVFPWQHVMPSSSSTLSDAGYAAQASRGRAIRLSGRIQLTDQDIIEADSNTLVDNFDIDEGEYGELANTTTLQLESQIRRTDTPVQPPSWRPLSPSPLIDTSRTDIVTDGPAEAYEDVAEDMGIVQGSCRSNGNGEGQDEGRDDDGDVAEEVEPAGRSQLRSSHTFGPGTSSAFADTYAPSLSIDDQGSDSSLEVVELSCFALTTPSDDVEQLAVHLDQDGIDTDTRHPVGPLPTLSDTQVPSTPQAWSQGPTAQMSPSPSLDLARTEALDTNEHIALGFTGLPGLSSASPYPTSQHLLSTIDSDLRSSLVSPGLPRSSFVPRPFLLGRAPTANSGPTSPSTPGAQRPLLLGQADGPHQVKAVGSGTKPCTNATSLGLSMLQLARSSVSSSSTSHSKASSGLLSPTLSLGGYMQYSMPQSPDWTQTCDYSRISDEGRDSQSMRCRSSYVVLPASLSTLTGRSARRASKAHSGSLRETNRDASHTQADAVQETLAILDGKRDERDVSSAASTHIGAAVHQLTGSAL